MRYFTTLNPTITAWENNDPVITQQLTVDYAQLLIDNKLDPREYKPVLGWDYENDDFAKNRITLILEAVKIKIGIAITTRNRPIAYGRALSAWCDYLPEGAKLVTVDDASDCDLVLIDDSFANTFRFEENVGITKAKNKCLELLEDCDHIFIADDDFFPTSPDWWKPYVNSGLNHACYTFDRRVIQSNHQFIEYEKPCGCLMYFRKICLETVGGWDTDFKGYSYEHVNISDRIFNAGLTPARYIDVPNSHFYFKSLDQDREVASSVPNDVRAATIPLNRALYEQNFNSKEFKPYK